MFARLRDWMLVLSALLTLAVPALADPAASAIRVQDLGGGKLRLAIDFSQLVDFHFFFLADPYRVVFDFPTVKWQVPVAADAKAQGIVQGFRFGQFQPTVSRLVIDAAGPVEVVRARMMAPRGTTPAQLIVDLRPTDRTSFLAAVRRTPPPAPGIRPETPVAAAKPPSKDLRKIIVLDPGHGGVDPGAVGVSGIFEKEVTLAIAQEVRRKLVATGRYRVVLTRDSDEFVSLADRVKIGREAHGDLFISIHADAISDKTIRGGTVYTLSQTASDNEAEALANKENKADIIAGVDLGHESDDVTSILIDLAQRETMNHSASFAQVLVKELGHKLLMHRNGHRFAGFRVLKAPDVPSVLIEIGYLSSRQDEEILRSNTGKAKVADAVLGAVDKYFAAPKS